MTDRSGAYDFLLVIHSDHGSISCTVSKIQRDIVRNYETTLYPRVFNASAEAGSLLNFVTPDGFKNQNEGYQDEKKLDDICSRFDTIHDCDGQTDGHRTMACTALCIQSIAPRC